MSDPYLVWVEDDYRLRATLSHVLGVITQLKMILYGTSHAFASSEPIEGTLVLVTDGNLGDGTCLDVIEHAVEIYGANRLGGTVLIFSGDPEREWHQAMHRASALGLVPFFIMKPGDISVFETWWSHVRTRFNQ